MPSPVPAWYETDGTTPEPGPLSFSALVPGVASAWQTRRLYNDHGGTAGSDPLLGRRLRSLARTDSGDEFVASGHPIVDQLSVEAQILGGDAADAVPGGAVFLGAGSTLPIPSLGSDEYVEMRFRVTLPPGFGPQDAQIALALDPAPAASTGDGGPLMGRGISDYLGQRSQSEILAPFTISPRSPESAFVDLSDAVGVVQGRTVVDLAHEHELTNADGSAATLASGEAYAALFSLGPGGVTVTKGDKATAPLVVADYPDLPSGHKRLGVVVRDFAGTIAAGDIFVTAQPRGFDYLGAAARVVTISGGDCLVGARVVYVAGSLSLTIPAMSTETVYLLGDGSLNTAPAAGRDAHPLWEFTADGSSITAAKDLRAFGHPGSLREVELFLGGGGSDEMVVVLPAGPPLSIHPLRAFVVSLLESDPSSLGASSGSWVLEVEYRAPAAAGWTTLFTSSGTDDRRPTLAESSTDPEFSAALPEVCTVPGGSSLRFSWDSVPSGGTPSEGAAIRMRLVEVP